MQITVKVKRRGGKAPKDVVRDCVKAINPKASVEEVFPGVQQGHRAGLVTVTVPGEVSKDVSQAILKALRDDTDVEYAEPSAPRKPR